MPAPEEADDQLHPEEGDEVGHHDASDDSGEDEDGGERTVEDETRDILVRALELPARYDAAR